MGSESNNNGGHAASAGNNAQIPSPVKKVIRNIREVISDQYNDSEIYAALRECDMDPNDAVQHLLSQGPPKDSDTFHRVKSKREKRKEMKENQEVKARANSGILNRGGRVGGENCVWESASVHVGSNELDKGSCRRENDSVACLQSASSAYHTTRKRSNEKCSPQSDSLRPPPGSCGTSLGIQSTWSGSSSSHASMADIVRGRPCTKSSEVSSETSYTPQDDNAPNSFSCHMKHSHESTPLQPEIHDTRLSLNLDMRHESEKMLDQHNCNNEWPVIEKIPASSGPPAVLGKSASMGVEMYSSLSGLHSDRYSQSDEIQLSKKDAVDMKNHYGGNTRSAQAFSGQEGTDRSTDKSLPNHSTSLPGDVNKTVMAATMNLQNISLAREQPAVSPSEDNCGLVLPDYLQAFAADCSHLSFGTYTSGKNSAPPVPQTSSPLSAEVEKPSAATDSSSATHLDSRNSMNFGDELLGYTHDTSGWAAADTRTDPSLYAEGLNHHLPTAAYGEDYLYSSVPDSNFGNSQQKSSAKNFTSFSSELQLHSKSVANDPLVAKARRSAVFHEAQSMPSGYRNQSINPSTISMSEVFNSGAFAMPQPSSLPLHGASLPFNSGRSYSGAGYGMAETYGFTSAFPQSHGNGGCASYGSAAGMEYNPRHISAIPGSSLPRPSSNMPAYGSLQNSDDLYHDFLRDLSMAKTSRKVGNDGTFTTPYNDGNNITPYLQNDGSATWDNWRGSTTLETSGYNFPEQYQHNHGYQLGYQHHAADHQDQLRSQHKEAIWHASMYGSQLGFTPEQQQSLGDLALNGSQHPPSKQVSQPPHIWRPSY